MRQPVPACPAWYGRLFQKYGWIQEEALKRGGRHGNQSGHGTSTVGNPQYPSAACIFGEKSETAQGVLFGPL